jgi:arylsulfatase A
MTVSEYAFDRGYKLYRDGRFFDLAADPAEAKPLKVADLTGRAADAAKKLQAALDQFKAARPAELDKRFRDSLKKKN